MALHAGTAEERDGDYFGPVVNRIARLLEAGHGGQILLSRATQELARDHLPAASRLRDLGEHRLKDLTRPERVFQLLHPDLPADFPPLATLDARSCNLPAQPTLLIGRQRELETARDLLRREDVRLLTFTGPGGTGKTRLGLQVAAEMLADFTHGVFFVSLAPISDPELVASAIAQVLGVRETGGQSLREGLHDYLREKQMLLLLDNFEQVLEAAPLVAELLASCPRLKVLVTSRAALRLRGEKEFPVPPLALPDLRHLPPIEALSQYAAVELFIQRAVDVQPEFAVTNENAPAVAEICARLDGLPLAIELAAARIKLFPPQALLSRLGNRLKLLTGGARDLPARQQTLRDAIAWSYDLLPEPEQKLFRRLAAFVGGCTLEAAEAVVNAAGDLEIEALDGIASLIGKSLVRQEAEAGGEPRFGMLETIREYGLECLAGSGEADASRQRHAEWFMALAEEAEPELWRDGAWLERLETEHDNLRAALDWSADSRPQAGLRLAGTLGWFWWIRGHWTEARQRLETALAASASVEAAVRWKALCAAGYITADLGDANAARALGEESLALCRKAGDKEGIAWSLIALAEAAQHQGQYTEAAALAEESLPLFRKGEDRRGTALALHTLALALGCGSYNARPVALEEESLALCRPEGYRWLAAVSLSHLGYLWSGVPERARALLEEGLAIHREFGNRAASAFALRGLGYIAMDTGDGGRALALYTESLALLRECGNKQEISGVHCEIGRLALAGGEYERARVSFGEALSLSTELCDDSGIHGVLLDLARLAHGQRDVKTARALLERVRALPQGLYGCSNQGHLLLEWGDYGVARSCYEEYLALLREGGHMGPIPFALLQVGHAAWLQGEHSVMQSHAAEALRLLQAWEDQAGMLPALESLGVAALAQGQQERAARLMGAVDARREALRFVGPGWWRPFRERIREAARAASLEQQFAAAWAEGRAMSLEDAIAYALTAERT